MMKLWLVEFPEETLDSCHACGAHDANDYPLKRYGFVIAPHESGARMMCDWQDMENPVDVREVDINDSNWDYKGIVGAFVKV